jgi:hypothetical protein
MIVLQIQIERLRTSFRVTAICVTLGDLGLNVRRRIEERPNLFRNAKAISDAETDA